MQASHPQTVRTQTQNYGNKKDVGVCLSRAYPLDLALALPLNEDKQRRACPRRVIYTLRPQTILYTQ